MNRHDEFDRVVAAYMAEGPSRLADRVLTAALEDVHATRQRRRSVSWRVTRPVREHWQLATAAMVALMIVGVGAYLGNSSSGGVGGTPAATPSLTPMPTPTPVPLPPGNPTALAAGTYRMGGGLGAPSVASLPALTFTVGDGWLAFNDSHSNMQIYKEGTASISMATFAAGEDVNVNFDCGSGPMYSPAPVIDGTVESVIAFMQLGPEIDGPVTDLVFKGLPAKSLTATGNVPDLCRDGVPWDRSRARGQTTRTTFVVEVDGGVVQIDSSRWLDADPAVQHEIDEIIDSIRFDPPSASLRASAIPQ